MKILLYGLNINPPWIEGIRNSVWNLAKNLKRENNTVYILTKGLLKDKKINNIKGINFIKIPVARSNSYNEGSLSFFIKSFREIRKITNRYKIDIVHGHSSYPLIGIAEKFSDASKIFTLYSKLNTTSKNLEYNIFMKYFLSIAKSGFTAKILSKSVNKVICLTKGIYDTLPEKVKEKSSVIPLGVDVNRFNPSLTGEYFKKKNHVENKKLIFMVGDITPWKGSENFILAAKRIIKQKKNVKFFLFSKGTYEYEKRRLLKIKGLLKEMDLQKYFTILGRYKEIENVYAASDISVFPYLDAFALMSIPLSLLENMALGKPVIATRVGDINNIITNGDNGFLVSPGSVDELAEKILYLLDNENEAKRISFNARKTVEINYSWDNISKKYLSLYSSLLA